MKVEDAKNAIQIEPSKCNITPHGFKSMNLLDVFNYGYILALMSAMSTVVGFVRKMT